MGKLVLTPVSRMAMPGSTTTFKIHLDDGEASSIRVVPEEGTDGYKVALPGGGTEAPARRGDQVLSIKVPPGVPMA